MPVINPDLSQLPVPLEPDTYPAKITATEVGVSKAGNPKLVVTFEITAGNKTEIRTSDLPFQGKGAGGFGRLLRACHMRDVADKFAAGQGGDFNTDDLVGQSLNVVVENEIYNGDTRDRVVNYLPA